MFWVIGIVALSTLIVVVGAYVRRRYRSSESTPGLGLTLEELHRINDRDDMTEQKFKSLKNKLVVDMRIGNAAAVMYKR